MRSMSSKDEIRLCEAQELARMDWGQLEDGEYARDYLTALLADTPTRHVHNVRTQLLGLLAGGRVMPVTVNDAEYDNSYVCSPYTHFVAYAREELDMLDSRLLKRLFTPVLAGVGLWMKRSRCNQIAIVNNWLLSTNLYHAWTAEQAGEIARFCAKKFPRHVIAFRSVCQRLCPELYSGLKQAGCIMVPSRYVYLFHPDWPGEGTWRVRNTLSRDRKLLAKSGYRVLRHDELAEGQAERIVELYNALYLDKYSRLNPQFSEEFVRLAMRRRTLTLIGLEKDGRLDGIVGYFVRNGVMTTPLFGYDTRLPRETGLYRMLSSLLVQEAEREGLLLHQSAGVGAFKADRGAIGEPEYTAVYVRHLPPYRRWIWQALAFLLERIGIRLVEKYEL